MAECCTCGCSVVGKEVLFLTCAGGSNVGQLSNQAGVELAKAGIGKLFCLAAIGGHIPAFLDSAKEKHLVVIDGCPQACAKKTVEHAELPVGDYVMITDLGIKKLGSFDLAAEDIETVCNKVKELLGKK